MLRQLTFALALALASISGYAQQVDYADILGTWTWTLTRVLDSAEVMLMNDQVAAQLIGKAVAIRPDTVVVAGEDCGEANFERRREPAAKYVREGYHAPVGRLGLADIITVVDLGCTGALLKSQDRIMVF